MPRVDRTLTVQAPVDRVYQWWARWENLPSVLPRIRQVKRTGPLTTHWTAEDNHGQLIEWDAVITQDLPQRQLAWEAKAGPVKLKGLVEFETLPNDATRLHLVLSEEGGTGPMLLGELADLDAGLATFQADIESHPPMPPLPIAYPYRDLFYRAMAATAGVLLVGGMAWGLVNLMEVWMILLGALLVGATLNPAVIFLMKWRLPRLLAVAVTFLTVLVGLGVVFVVLIPGIMAQGQELASKLPAYAGELQSYLTRLNTEHPNIPAGTQVMEFLAAQASSVLGNAFSLTTRFVWILVVALSVLFLSLFMLLDGARLQDTLMRLMPIPQRSHMPALLHTVQERVGQYMLGVAFICGLAGVLTWAVLAVMGVPYALLIGAAQHLAAQVQGQHVALDGGIDPVGLGGPVEGGGCRVEHARPARHQPQRHAAGLGALGQKPAAVRGELGGDRRAKGPHAVAPDEQELLVTGGAGRHVDAAQEHLAGVDPAHQALELVAALELHEGHGLAGRHHGQALLAGAIDGDEGQALPVGRPGHAARQHPAVGQDRHGLGGLEVLHEQRVWSRLRLGGVPRLAGRRLVAMLDVGQPAVRRARQAVALGRAVARAGELAGEGLPDVDVRRLAHLAVAEESEASGVGQPRRLVGQQGGHAVDAAGGGRRLGGRGIFGGRRRLGRRGEADVDEGEADQDRGQAGAQPRAHRPHQVPPSPWNFLTVQSMLDSE
ncbi:MAG: AI-2E family transporter [Candidatus Sericytochromatia bacterium]